MRKMNENERRDKGKNLFRRRFGIHCREKTGVIKQISISFRLSVVSLYDTLLIPSGAVKRSFFRFLISSAFFPKTFPLKNPCPLPTMEVSNYEKQVFLYGRHRRDAVGCGVGSDGRGKQGMVWGTTSVYGVVRRVAVRQGGTRDFFKRSVGHCECECEEEPQKCLGGFV